MFTFFLNGKAVRSEETEACRYAIFSSDTAEVRTVFPGVRSEDVTVRPAAREMRCEDTPDGAALSAEAPAKLCVAFAGEEKPLFLFLYRTEEAPQPSEHVRVLGAGEHDMEEIPLASGDTLYLCEGARLHGRITALDAEDITVCGRGVIDVSDYQERRRRVLLFRSTARLSVRDITIVGADDWSFQLNGCRDVRIDSVNIITWNTRGDGIDIVGSHDVTVENACIRTADDCVVLKATDYNGPEGCADVYNIAVRHCVFWNARPGNGIEIGFETRCDEIRDVVFEDIDILCCEFEGWQSGGALTIHNGDRARIHRIVYRNIRIERAEEKLIDFKVLDSRYSRDKERGVIEDILLENIDVTGGELMPSILQGHTVPGRDVRNVTFRGVRYLGRTLTDRAQLHLLAERTHDIRFERGEEE